MGTVGGRGRKSDQPTSLWFPRAPLDQKLSGGRAASRDSHLTLRPLFTADLVSSAPPSFRGEAPSGAPNSPPCVKRPMKTQPRGLQAGNGATNPRSGARFIPPPCPIEAAWRRVTSQRAANRKPASGEKESGGTSARPKLHEGCMVPGKGRGWTGGQPVASTPGWAGAGLGAWRANGGARGAGPESKRVRVSPGSSPRCRCSRRRRVSGEAPGGREGGRPGRARPGRGREGGGPEKAGQGAEEPAGPSGGSQNGPRGGKGAGSAPGSREEPTEPGGKASVPPAEPAPQPRGSAAGGLCAESGQEISSSPFGPPSLGIASLRPVRGALRPPRRRLLFPAAPCATRGSGAGNLLFFKKKKKAFEGI